jgi:hypothetical protein
MEIESTVYHAGVLQGGQMLNRVFYVIPILFSTLVVIGCASEASYEQLSYHDNVVFYLSPVTQEQAQKVVDLYVKNNYFTKDSKSELQLKEESGAFEIRAGATIETSGKSSDYTIREFHDESFMELGCFQNKYALPDENLTYVITENNDFEKVLKKYPSPCSSKSIGRNAVFGNNSFFYLAPVEQDQALKIMNYLIGIALIAPDTNFESQLIYGSDRLEFRFPSQDGLALEGFSQTFKSISCGLESAVEEPVDIILVDYVGSLEAGKKEIARYACEN